MLNSRNNFIRNYLSVSLSEHHMATLASIIKEVDKDGLKGQWTGWVLLQGTWGSQFPSNCLLLSAGSSDEDFAAALYHFNHSLVTSDLQSPNLQVGVRPCCPGGSAPCFPWAVEATVTGGCFVLPLCWVELCLGVLCCPCRGWDLWKKKMFFPPSHED